MTPFKKEELWEVWYLEPPYETARMQQSWKEIPQDLIERFTAAKAEMEEVWSKMRPYLEEDY